MILEALVIFYYIFGRYSAESGYIVSTPFTWVSGVNSQICVSLTNGIFSSEDEFQYNLFEAENKEVIQPETSITFTEGLSFECVDVVVPNTSTGYLRVTLHVQGSLNSELINEKVNLTLVDQNERVFITTDKYLYRQGQTVQFRVLTLRGPEIKVVTENYEEIYVENPSRTRIAQFNDVENSGGLIHLSFDLYTDIDEGVYTIHVNGNVKSFEVRDYVPPRFEVTITSQTILGSDETFTLQLCATYVFGEPVKGNATIYASVGNFNTVYANISQTKEIEGCQNFTFDTKDLYFDNNNCHIRILQVQGNAIVTEAGTGVEIFADTTYLTVHRKGITFEDMTINDVQKPYLPVIIEIRVKYADGTPAIDETMEACTFFEDENICKNFTTNNEGVLTFVIPSQIRNYVTIRAVNFPRIERNFNDVMSESSFTLYFNNYEKYFDPTNTFITIMQNMIECTTGEDIEFKIPVVYATTQEITTDVYLQIQSRGQNIAFKKMSVAFSGSDLGIQEEDKLIPLETAPEGVILGKFEIPITLSERASPDISILVWFVKEDGTVVADSSDVSVSECLSHKVDFSWSEPRVGPGEEATLMIRGAEKSLCSIGVVDKSVEILSAGNNNNLDISAILSAVQNSYRSYGQQTNLQYCLNKYGKYEGEQPSSTPSSKIDDDSDTSFYYWNIVQALHMFNDAGYAVISNLFLEKQFCEELIYQDMKNEYFDPDYDNSLGGGLLPLAGLGGLLQDGLIGEAGIAQDEESFQERSYLPETWLWLLRTLSETGELNETMTLPDTITEWVGSAVCVHPEEGVGISETSSIITFTPFFLDLTLPSTVVRGEVLPIIISIFNYLDEDLPVKVFIELSENYEFIDGESGEREVCVPSQSTLTASVKVNLIKLGQIDITVEASSIPSLSSGSCGSGSSSISKSDRLIKPLLVEAEGYLRERVFTEYICTEDIENPTSPVATWLISPPEEAVKDSGRAWVTAVGDILGPTIENLGNLVRMPNGCGEQNMINFAPIIYFLQYLELTNQNTPELEGKLKGFLNEGYQRQLKFKRRDGSYSTFGKKDKDGSTWLTAFVVKSFTQAVPYTLIDIESLQQSREWLLGLQKEDGCFEARGRVVNKMLQGGVSGSEGSKGLLAAYVLASLLEGGSLSNETEEADRLSNVTQLALQCIATDTSTHPYSLALRSYALALAKAPNTKSVIDELLDLGISTSSMLRWSLPDRPGESTPLHVETAAYALLSIVTFDYEQYKEEARKIVRWLSSQMNGQGGFASTQDTVVALQALSAFEKKVVQEDINMDVTVSAANFSTVFKITEVNKLLQQRKDLPSLPAEVAINVNGTGCALVQGVLRYNVLADSVSEMFSLDVNVSQVFDSQCNDRSKSIDICTSYQLPDDRSNMAIIQIKLVTGYVPNKDDIEAIVGDGEGVFKDYEIDGKLVTLYLEEITADKICISFKADQTIPIDSAKPGFVSVYDFYQPQYIVTRTLDLNSVSCDD